MFPAVSKAGQQQTDGSLYIVWEVPLELFDAGKPVVLALLRDELNVEEGALLGPEVVS